MADGFVARVREDSNWNLIANTLANPIGQPAAIADALETACYLVWIFGEELCMEGIEAVVQTAVRIEDIADAQILADAAARGASAVPRGSAVYRESLRPRLTAWLDELVDNRLDSLVVLDAIANTSPDMNRRFEVRLEIVSRNPDSGRARFDLAQQYFNREQWGLAMPHLELARELLPPDDEFQNLVLEYLREAEYEIGTRN